MSTESYHKSPSSVNPILLISATARPGTLELVRNRFTGKTYLVASPVKLLPAPVASQPAARRTHPEMLDQTTIAGRQQAVLLRETGAASLKDAFQVRFAAYLASREVGHG